MKKILLVLCLTVMLFGGSEKQNTVSETENYVSNNDRILSDRNSYCVSLYKDIIEDMPSGNKDASPYPDNYAGAFIDSSDTLHIIFTDEPEENSVLYSQKLSAENRTAVSDGYIVFGKGEFSINYLNEILNALYSAMDEFQICEGFLNQTENKVEIGIADMDGKEAVLSFLKSSVENFDERSVSFFQSDGLS